jgi:hypothetical protein
MSDPSAIRRVLTAATAATPGRTVEHCLAPDVALVVVWDGSGRLIDLCGDCYALPAGGTRLLELSLEIGTEAAAEQIATECAAPAGRVKADAEAFLGDLFGRGLLVRPTERVAHGRRTSRLQARAVAASVRCARWVFRSDARRSAALLAIAYASIRLLGWARTVELWRAVFVATSCAAERTGDATERLDAIEHTVREAISRSPFPVDCKARALCSWAMVRSAGRPARLVVGIDLFPFLGHCWCESESRVLGDGSDRCGRFNPVLQYS